MFVSACPDGGVVLGSGVVTQVSYTDPAAYQPMFL